MGFEEKKIEHAGELPPPVEDRQLTQTRLRSYLEALGVPEVLLAPWIREASEGASSADEAFLRLERLMACHHTNVGLEGGDDVSAAACFQLHIWLDGTRNHVDADITAQPPLVRQSMAS